MLLWRVWEPYALWGFLAWADLLALAGFVVWFGAAREQDG